MNYCTVWWNLVPISFICTVHTNSVVQQFINTATMWNYHVTSNIFHVGLNRICTYVHKQKRKVHPVTCREGTVGEKRYSTTPSLTSAYVRKCFTKIKQNIYNNNNMSNCKLCHTKVDLIADRYLLYNKKKNTHALFSNVTSSTCGT